MELVASEWGQAKTFPLPFIEYGATNYLTGVTLAEGDVKISKDGGAFINIDTLPTVLGAWMIITLSPTEMQARSIAFQAIDQTATKVFEDTGAILTTDMRSWQQALFMLIESQRGTHTGVIEQFFFDPINGNDNNSGRFWHDAKLTYTFNGAGGIHSLLSNNQHQIVHLLPQAGGAPTTINEYIEVDTAYTFLRGPGRDFLIEATHNEACAVLSSAEGVEFSGFRTKTRPNGSQDAICTTGDFTWMHKLWVDFSQGAGIQLDNASSCILDDFLIQDAAQGGSGHAVHLLGDTSLTTRNLIGKGQIFSNGNGGGGADGIRVDGEFNDHNFITGGDTALLIHDNTGYGINEVNGADHTIIIGPTVSLHHNTLGDHSLIGDESLILNHEQWAKDTDLQTVIAAIAALPQTAVSVLSYPGEFGQPATKSGGHVLYPRETLSSFPYDLNADITGKTIKFMAKLDLSDEDASAAIPLKDITSSVTDAANGLGLVPLTEAESDLLPKTYYAEVQSIAVGGEVEARWLFRLEIVDNVIDGV